MKFIPLSRPEELKAAGLPWGTYGQAQWAYRQRHVYGLSAAFVRQGKKILVNVDRALELLGQQAAA